VINRHTILIYYFFSVFVSAQNNLDTLYYYEKDKLTDYFIPHIPINEDGGVFFEIDSSINYKIKEIDFLWLSELDTSLNLPFSHNVFINYNSIDKTPGSIISTINITFNDSSDFYPHWYNVNLDTVPEVQHLTGSFWITRLFMLWRTVNDTVYPYSGHTYGLEYNISWESVDFDIAVRAIIEPVTVKINNEIDLYPVSFAMEQNYPNPFNSKTKIPIKVTSESEIKFSIYDLNGRLISQYHTNFQPGQHSIDWDGKNMEGMNVTSGIYLYNAQQIINGTTTHSKTKKMLLLR